MRQKSTLLGVLVLASVTWVSAQSGRLTSIDVPFEFTIGHAVLPAGNYSVDLDANHTLLSFRETSGKGSSRVLIAGRRGHYTSKAPDLFTLVFDKVGSRRYLSEVRVPGRNDFLVRSFTPKPSHDVLPAE